MSAPRKNVENGRRAVPHDGGTNVSPPNNDLAEKPKYDDWLPTALGQFAADIASAWEGEPTFHKHRRLALLLDELLSLIEGDADVQQIFTRLPFALDKGLILQSFYSLLFPAPPEVAAEPVQTDVRLTNNERRVLQAMADGLLSKEMIGRATEIKPNTVHTHRYRMYQKLEVHDEIEAVGKGVRLGLVQFDAIKFVTNIVRKKFNWVERNPPSWSRRGARVSQRAETPTKVG